MSAMVPTILKRTDPIAVADPGFPVGGGRQLPRRLCFEKFVCQNERNWTLRGARAGGVPLDPPMNRIVL